MWSMMAFITSVTWDALNLPYRLTSKLVFNGIATIFLSYSTYSVFQDTDPDSTFERATCTNICPDMLNQTIISNCNDYQTALPRDFHIGYIVFLWILLALSTLEGILEKFVPWMPRNKFLEPIESEKENPDIELN